MSLDDCAHAYGHSWHLYGFSPVCERRWTVRLLQFLNIFPQYSHVSLRRLPGAGLLRPDGLGNLGLPLLLKALEACGDKPFSEAAAAASIVTMHRVTGAFVDPSLEPALGAHVFSVSFPVHILLLVIILVLWTWNALARTDKLAYWFVSGMVDTVAPVGRVLIHR